MSPGSFVGAIFAIRYQSDLPLTSRGFSVASAVRRKCPPELVSGIDRVIDFFITNTRCTRRGFGCRRAWR